MADKQYNVKLDDAEVNGYWRTIGMSEEAWMKLSQAQRVQSAWTDMQAKLKAAREARSKALEHSEE